MFSTLGVNVKAELDATTPPNIFSRSGPSNEPSTQPFTPTWKSLDGESLLNQVKIREAAVSAGVAFLKKVELTLQTHSKVVSCNRQSERIHGIRSRKKELVMKVGFLGASGVGKSTLINALLQQVDLAPCNDGIACTAVVVEIAWNPSNDPASAFVADIELISKDDWRVEIEMIYADLKDLEQAKNGEDGDMPDNDRLARIKEVFEKIQAVYPDIKKEKDLESTSIDKLLRHDNVHRILGRTKSLKSDSLEDFRAMLRSFVDCSKNKDSSRKPLFKHWPLIKCCKVYTKSEILKDGIVLVDLPGTMDVNAGRSAIAEKSLKELRVACVVADCVRAPTDSAAQEILLKVIQRNLQLDGIYNSERLCFVVSKVDHAPETDSYIRDNQHLQEELAPVIERDKNIESRLEELKGQRAELDKSRRKNELRISKLKKEIKKLKPRVDEIRSKSTSSQRKRKRDSDAEEAGTSPYTDDESAVIQVDSDMHTEGRKLTDENKAILGGIDAISKRIPKIEKAKWAAECQMVKVCIRDRNEMYEALIKDDYEDTLKQLGREGPLKPLQVFCVAARVFIRFLKDKPNTQGFPAREDTRIPALRDWLISTTLVTRDSNARAFLEEVRSFFAYIELWSNDTLYDYRMSAEKRALVESSFEEMFKVTEQQMHKLGLGTATAIQKLTEIGIYVQFPELEETAKSRAMETVAGWTSLAWSTHRAVNKRRGLHKSSSKIVHNWNEELAGTYLDSIKKKWVKTFHTQFPLERVSYNTKIQDLIIQLADSLIKSVADVCPQITDALHPIKDSIMQKESLLKNCAATIFDGIIDTTKDAHRLVKPAIYKSWEPIYDQCGAEGGRGHYLRNQETHRFHIKENGVSIYQEASSAIMSKLENSFLKLPGQFNASYSEVIGQIKEELTQMLDRHSSNGSRVSSRRSISVVKLTLLKDLEPSFNFLKEAWSENVEPQTTDPQKRAQFFDSDSDLGEEDIFAAYNEDDSGGNKSDDDLFVPET